MPSKRDVLAILTCDELLMVADRFGLAPPDRRAKDGLVETVASSKKASLAELLPELSRDRLKERLAAPSGSTTAVAKRSRWWSG
jgi:hypothetical protein